MKKFLQSLIFLYIFILTNKCLSACNSSCKFCFNSFCYCDSEAKNFTCHFKAKYVRTAMTFSIFLGYFGADWFYLSNGNIAYIIIGFIKLSISLLFLVSFIYLRFYNNSFRLKRQVSSINETYELKNDYNENFSKLFNLVFILGFIALTWFIVDIFRVPNNTFKDGNGVDLIKCEV